MQNYEFYAREDNEGIEKIHSKRGDYRWLEDKHDYIQWLLPNHYQSSFNSHSFAMGYLEA